jgi:uncharacterized protein (DUF1015 family)
LLVALFEPPGFLIETTLSKLKNMANLTPFRGVLYDPTVVKDIANVVAPPYDIIDANYQKALYERHPNNIIRLELGMDAPGDSPIKNRYTRAAEFLTAWLKSGALRRDTQPSLYLYMIEYRPPSDDAARSFRTLKGFFSTVELEEFGTGRIFPHENTRSAAKADRLNLLEACHANFSAIFSLYSDPDNRVMQLLEKSVDLKIPRLDFQDDTGLRQRLWSVSDPAVVQAVHDLMQPKPLFIADGHHRYETSLRYRQLRRQQNAPRPEKDSPLQPSDSVLMLFAALEDPGLTVLPTHRVLTHALPELDTIKAVLENAFDIHELPFQPSEKDARSRFLDSLRSQGQSGTVFGLAIRNAPAYFVLSLRASHRPPASASERDKLDVSILQHEIVGTLCPTSAEQEAIVYTKDGQEALDLVQQGKATGALLLNATKVSEVRAVAASGGRMPHKSTYFFPKPLTGLVINLMEE